MVFNPNLGSDLFISYARVDDEPVFGVKWVSTLLQDLRNLLAQKTGRLDAFSIWWDETDLRGNHAVTPEIRTAVQQSATMLLVLSPGYLESQWCRQEKDLFFEVLGGQAMLAEAALSASPFPRLSPQVTPAALSSPPRAAGTA
jgi:hypothetical protein